MHRCIWLGAACLLIVCLLGCGRRQPQSGPDPATPDARDFLQRQLAELDTLPVPAGVAPGLWVQLTSSLHEQLAARLASGKAAGGAPLSALSQTTLSLDSGAGLLQWQYYNQGDYDQNGEVNVSDLTPIAQHFHLSSGGGAFPANSIESVVDGDNNGEINPADITPIAQNLGSRLQSYNVYLSTDQADVPADGHAPNGAGAQKLSVVELSTGSGDAHQQRLAFTTSVGTVPAGAVYWVRPDDQTAGAGTDGTPSTVVGPGAPVVSSIRLYQLSFDYGGGVRHDSTDWGNVEVHFAARPETLYFNLTFNGTRVLTNVPLISTVAAGRMQSATLPFNLGTASGTPVTQGSAAYSLTTSKTASGARTASDEISLPIAARLQKGVPSGGVAPFAEPPAAANNEFGFDPAQAGSTLQIAYHYDPFNDFPDAEYGPNEGTAAAVSNSLAWLRGRFGLPIGGSTDKPIDVATMRQACGEVVDNGSYRGAPSAWPTNKDQYMQDHEYPIETRFTRSVQEAYDALKNDYDVEIVAECQDGDTTYQRVWCLTAIAMATDSNRVMVQGVDDYYEDCSNYQSWTYDQLVRVNLNGYEECRLRGYFGECPVGFVIESPQLGLEWQGEEIYNLTGPYGDACIDGMGNVAVPHYGLISQQLELGALLAPLYAQTPIAQIDTQGGTQPNISIGLVGAALRMVYCDYSAGVYKLKSIELGGNGEWGTPTLIDSDPVSPPGESVDWKVKDGLQYMAFFKSTDLYTVHETAIGSNTFTSPLHVMLPNGPPTNPYGWQVKLQQAGDNSWSLGYNNAHTIKLLDHYDFDTGTCPGQPADLDSNVYYWDFIKLDSGYGTLFSSPTTMSYRFSADGISFQPSVSFDGGGTSFGWVAGANIGGKPAAAWMDTGPGTIKYSLGLDGSGGSWPAQPETVDTLQPGATGAWIRLLDLGGGKPMILEGDNKTLSVHDWRIM
jgi:hypothetical protein